MNPSNDIRICISPSQGKIIIEEQDGPVTTRKEVDQQSLISCFKTACGQMTRASPADSCR